MKEINSFSGYYDFLSNFYKAGIVYEGRTYPTTEHFYQAYKAMNKNDHDEIRMVPGPGSAKKLGQKVTLRKDWEDIKDSVMKMALLLKFTQHPELAKKLVDTGKVPLIEGNNWGDTYWGVVNDGSPLGLGFNMLGKLLMSVRDYFSEHEVLL